MSSLPETPLIIGIVQAKKHDGLLFHLSAPSLDDAKFGKRVDFYHTRLDVVVAAETDMIKSNALNAEILRHLAKSKEACTALQIGSAVNKTGQALSKRLSRMQDHDLIVSTDGGWRLFRDGADSRSSPLQIYCTSQGKQPTTDNYFKPTRRSRSLSVRNAGTTSRQRTGSDSLVPVATASARGRSVANGAFGEKVQKIAGISRALPNSLSSAARREAGKTTSFSPIKRIQPSSSAEDEQEKRKSVIAPKDEKVVPEPLPKVEFGSCLLPKKQKLDPKQLSEDAPVLALQLRDALIREKSAVKSRDGTKDLLDCYVAKLRDSEQDAKKMEKKLNEMEKGKEEAEERCKKVILERNGWKTKCESALSDLTREKEQARKKVLNYAKKGGITDKATKTEIRKLQATELRLRAELEQMKKDLEQSNEDYTAMEAELQKLKGDEKSGKDDEKEDENEEDICPEAEEDEDEGEPFDPYETEPISIGVKDFDNTFTQGYEGSFFHAVFSKTHDPARAGTADAEADSGFRPPVPDLEVIRMITKKFLAVKEARLQAVAGRRRGGSQKKFTHHVKELFLKIGDSLCIIGDIHGQVEAIRAILEIEGVPYRTDGESFVLVFIGDLSDRGRFSAICLLGAYDLEIRNLAAVNRGNHESYDQNLTEGFMSELDKNYGGDKIWIQGTGTGVDYTAEEISVPDVEKIRQECKDNGQTFKESDHDLQQVGSEGFRAYKMFEQCMLASSVVTFINLESEGGGRKSGQNTRMLVTHGGPPVPTPYDRTRPLRYLREGDVLSKSEINSALWADPSSLMCGPKGEDAWGIDDRQQNNYFVTSAFMSHNGFGMGVRGHLVPDHLAGYMFGDHSVWLTSHACPNYGGGHAVPNFGSYVTVEPCPATGKNLEVTAKEHWCRPLHLAVPKMTKFREERPFILKFSDQDSTTRIAAVRRAFTAAEKRGDIRKVHASTVGKTTLMAAKGDPCGWRSRECCLFPGPESAQVLYAPRKKAEDLFIRVAMSRKAAAKKK